MAATAKTRTVGISESDNEIALHGRGINCCASFGFDCVCTGGEDNKLVLLQQMSRVSGLNTMKVTQSLSHHPAGIKCLSKAKICTNGKHTDGFSPKIVVSGGARLVLNVFCMSCVGNGQSEKLTKRLLHLKKISLPFSESECDCRIMTVTSAVLSSNKESSKVSIIPRVWNLNIICVTSDAMIWYLCAEICSSGNLHSKNDAGEGQVSTQQYWNVDKVALTSCYRLPSCGLCSDNLILPSNACLDSVGPCSIVFFGCTDGHLEVCQLSPNHLSHSTIAEAQTVPNVKSKSKLDFHQVHRFIYGKPNSNLFRRLRQISGDSEASINSLSVEILEPQLFKTSQINSLPPKNANESVDNFWGTCNEAKSLKVIICFCGDDESIGAGILSISYPNDSDSHSQALVPDFSPLQINVLKWIKLPHAHLSSTRVGDLCFPFYVTTGWDQCIRVWRVSVRRNCQMDSTAEIKQVDGVDGEEIKLELKSVASTKCAVWNISGISVLDNPPHPPLSSFQEEEEEEEEVVSRSLRICVVGSPPALEVWKFQLPNSANQTDI